VLKFLDTHPILFYYHQFIILNSYFSLLGLVSLSYWLNTLCPIQFFTVNHPFSIHNGNITWARRSKWQIIDIEAFQNANSWYLGFSFLSITWTDKVWNMDVTGDKNSSRAPNKCRLVITIFDKDTLKVNGDIMNMYIIPLGEIRVLALHLDGILCRCSP